MTPFMVARKNTAKQSTHIAVSFWAFSGSTMYAPPFIGFPSISQALGSFRNPSIYLPLDLGCHEVRENLQGVIQVLHVGVDWDGLGQTPQGAARGTTADAHVDAIGQKPIASAACVDVRLLALRWVRVHPKKRRGRSSGQGKTSL
jgi:hypothetical protein